MPASQFDLPATGGAEPERAIHIGSGLRMLCHNTRAKCTGTRLEAWQLVCFWPPNHTRESSHSAALASRSPYIQAADRMVWSSQLR